MLKIVRGKAKNDPSVTPERDELVHGLDFLADVCQELWREQNFERMLNSFLKISADQLTLTNASFYSLVREKNKMQLDKAEIEVATVPKIEPQYLALVEKQFLKMQLKNQEARQGSHLLHIEGRDIHFVLFGDPNAQWWVLFYEVALDRVVPERRSQVIEYLDFLTRQLQTGCRLHGRIDRTQALLYRDDLTSLFNVRYLELALDSEIRRAQRFQNNFSLLFIDLDNFKPVNDQYGHLAGSDVLRQLADVLRGVSREIDSVIRYGGDEFIVLLLGANANTGLLAAERIRQRIEKTPFKVDKETYVNLTACIGVASYPEHADDKEALLKMADECMYEGKRAGKNKVILVSSNSPERSSEKQTDL